MRKIQATAVVIVLALAGMVYAAGQMQETKNAPAKEKAAACCSTPGESCCTKGKCCDKSAGSEACCKSDKEDAACCTAMSKDAKAGEQQTACSCCQGHATGGTQAANHSSQACPADGTGCCSNCGDCCKDGACCKAKAGKQ